MIYIEIPIIRSNIRSILWILGIILNNCRLFLLIHAWQDTTHLMGQVDKLKPRLGSCVHAGCNTHYACSHP